MKKLIIVFSVILALCLGIAFTACGPSGSGQEPTYDPGIPFDGDPDKDLPEHNLTSYVKIDDETHGRYCIIHDTVEEAEEHDLVFSENGDDPRIVYDSEEGKYKIEHGGCGFHCSKCDHEGYKYYSDGEDTLVLTGDAKAQFISDVENYDTSQIEYASVSVPGYSYYDLMYQAEDGVWISQIGNMREGSVSVLNNLNRILEVFVSDYTVTKLVASTYDRGGMYLLEGKVAYDDPDNESQTTVDAQIMLDENCRLTYYYVYGIRSVEIAYDEDVLNENYELSQAAKGKATGQQRVYKVPAMPTFDTDWWGTDSLEYYSDTESYAYMEKTVKKSDGKAVVEYFMQKGLDGTVLDKNLYGIYDNGYVYYRFAPESALENEESMAATRQVTTRTAFYSNIVPLLTELKTILNGLSSLKYYTFVDPNYSGYVIYHFVTDEGIYYLSVSDGKFSSLSYYTRNMLKGQDDVPQFSPQGQTSPVFRYYTTSGFSDEDFPEYLFDAWHTHTYEEEYSFNNTKHWHEATCSCGGDAVTYEDHELVWGYEVPPAAGVTTAVYKGVCVCGYYEEESYDVADCYDLSFKDHLEITSEGFAIDCVFTPRYANMPQQAVVGKSVPIDYIDEATRSAVVNAYSEKTIFDYQGFITVTENLATQGDPTINVYEKDAAGYNDDLAGYHITEEFLNGLETQGYTLTFSLLCVTFGDVSYPVFYAVSAVGEGLPELLYYVNPRKAVTIRYYDEDGLNKGTDGVITLVYYYSEGEEPPVLS